MQANYISYFTGNFGMGQSESECQFETEAGNSNAGVIVKKASCPKVKREKSKLLVAKESELFSQYRLDLI